MRLATTISAPGSELIAELAAEFGSQAVVLAIDAKQDGEGWRVFVRGGHEAVAMDAVA